MSSRTLWKRVSAFGRKIGYAEVLCEFTQEGWWVRLPGKVPEIHPYYLQSKKKSGQSKRTTTWIKNGRIWDTYGLFSFLSAAHNQSLPCPFPALQYVTITCFVAEPITIGQRRVLTKLLQKCGWWWVRIEGKSHEQ